ncbi:MAG: hypothetical protein DWQ56_05520 [Microcystis aeruginosa DA14]|uniref:PIN domain-containing protein n=1 Tax=Microcystis aeruginosa DA14 TaxID=1987506 RepID=A0A3E0MLF4_MICAE|nr:MAG: hypothetical protein DWQ56_05520 [Microcystis aeruginosa DA14]
MVIYLGFDLYDSFHIACAEYARIDVLLTTDDRLLRKAIKYSKLLQVIKRESMSNPSRFIITKPTPPQLAELLPSQLWDFPLGKFPKNGLFSQ